MALWTWIATTATVATGVLILGLTPFLKLSGVDLLIGPLVIAAGVTAGAILAGLKHPWGVFILVIGVLVTFIVLKFLNPFGIGGVI